VIGGGGDGLDEMDVRAGMREGERDGPRAAVQVEYARARRVVRASALEPQEP
jgi:hypothetical protein